jgi:energy-coupling factor transport system ATP-binding protein
MGLAPIIRIENLYHTYQSETDQPIQALRDVTLTVDEGEYVVILGHNGSGKSTLAKHLNALLLPSQGEVWVKGWNTKDRAQTRNIRSTVGMVFQIPDNQIVATIVEEDVAFGPENLGLPQPEIVKRVDWSLERVDMLPLRRRAPHLLSAGQKQRVCIAGVLAMQPQVLVLDESTAMLDPLGRREVLDIAQRLNKEAGVTLIAITHYMEEAVKADRLVIMAEGQIVLQGKPREVFAQANRLRELQIDVPQITQLALALAEHDASFPRDILTVEEFVSTIRKWIEDHQPLPLRSSNGRPIEGLNAAPDRPPTSKPEAQPGEPIIEIKGATYYYMRGTPLQVKAIKGINLEVRRGEILGIIGHTGSGKSTVLQHLNALLVPHEGQVTIFGQTISSARVDVKTIRRRIGLVFQQPEAQLFEHYVGDDVAYGPRNLKLSREEVRARVRRAMEAVGLGFEAFKDRLTFSLSGGEMRRVALAGVLALEPETLVLDEPTAGLDPQGRRQLLDFILRLHDQEGLTLVLVSHNMEDLAQLCDRIYVVSGGQVAMSGTPQQIFSQPDRLRELGLGIPAVTDAIHQLYEAGLIHSTATALTVAQAVEILGQVLDEQPI